MSPLTTTAIGVLGALALIGAASTLSFRFEFRPVLTAIRRMNRRVMNPRQLQKAGQPGAWASVVHHVGRRTATPYRTPVVAVPAGGGFAIVLPYGPGTDWARNLMAAGGGTLAHDGQLVAVDRPEVVPVAEVDHLFAPRERRSHRRFGLREALVLHRSDREPGATSVAAPADAHLDVAGGQR